MKKMAKRGRGKISKRRVEGLVRSKGTMRMGRGKRGRVNVRLDEGR